MGRLISDKYKEWEAECNERFQKLKRNEEELNRIFMAHHPYSWVKEPPKTK